MKWAPENIKVSEWIIADNIYINSGSSWNDDEKEYHATHSGNYKSRLERRRSRERKEFGLIRVKFCVLIIETKE